MQMLGLADSTPKPDNRLKSLLWPTIRTRVDLDTVTTQGFWICAMVGSVTLALYLLSGYRSWRAHHSRFYAKHRLTVSKTLNARLVADLSRIFST
jgi:hypothetical protein